MKKSNNISLAKVGMSKDTSYDLLQKQNYTFAINMNIESESGDLFKLKSEHSNILASRFKDGYKVIGHGTSRTNGDTFFLLTNPTTKVSEFGVIKDANSIVNIDDVELECTDCEYKNLLSEPLEEVTQVASQTYTTLLEDSCNLGFNFDINFPVKKIVIKEEQLGVKVFFSDNLNPPRYIDTANLDKYLTTGTNVCGIDETTPTCLATDKLRLFPIYTPIRIEPDSLVQGGNLHLGEYSFYAAYSNKIGDEMSEYTSLTNPIAIFDENNRITNDTEALERTNTAIKLKVTSLDLNFAYYKIVVAQRNVIDGGVRYFEVGMFPSTVDSIVFNTEADKKEITINDILLPNPNIKLLEGFAESNSYLFGYGVTTEKEWNLQPVVNLLGGFFKWQTHIGVENLYAEGINSAKYKSFLRDEVYPLSVNFTTNTGYKTARFPLIGIPPTDTDLEVVTYLNKDTDSIDTSKGSCEELGRTKRWEFYNSALELGKYPLTVESSKITEPVTKVCTIENAAPGSSVLPGSFSIYDVEEFTSVIDFIEANPNCGSTYDFCQFTDPTNAPDCTPEFNTSKIIAGNFIVGNTYEILEPGTTSFMNIGALSNLAGTIFTATNSGSGDGTALLQNCDAMALVDEYMKVNSILDLTVDYIPFAFPLDYPTLKGASSCNVFDRNGSGDKYRDEEFMEDYMPGGTDDNNVWTRGDIYGNTSVSAADKLQVASDTSTPLGLAYYHNMYGGTGTDPDAVQFLQFQTTGISGSYLDSVHKGSLWFFVDLDSTPDSIFEFVKMKKTSEYSKTEHADSFTYRISVFSDRSGGTALFSKLINRGDNLKLKIKYTAAIAADLSATEVNKDYTYQIVTAGTTDFTNIGAADNNVGTIFTATADGVGTGMVSLLNLVLEDDAGSPIITNVNTSRNLYIAIDSEYKLTTDGDIKGYYITAPQYCYSVGLQSIQYSQIDVAYSGIIFDKFQRYISTCEFDMPILDECTAIPYAYGDFGYVESLETYPDNSELYDSSGLKITESDFITEDAKLEFKTKYAEGIESNGNYILKKDTNFTCNPIRHFKFPDNKVSPFLYSNPTPGFSPATIFPLGITVDENVINSFLDIAVTNNLISQEQRDSIVGYEVFRGDRTLNKGVLAKGMLYDMYNYTEDDKEIHFANFPFNDLGDNELYYEDEDSNTHLKHPFGGTSNYNFMFHSPDTEYSKPGTPSELKVEGYAFGSSKGLFNEVKEHPKYVILGKEARDLASTLATLEVIAEATVVAAQSAEVYRFDGGLVFSANPVGIVLNIIAIAANIISSALFKYGRYKYEWLQTFRNLGNPENFAQYYTAVGNYNYLQGLQEEGDLIRGINKSGYLKSGRFTVTNEVAGEKLEINHIDRESGLFLTLGPDFGIDYPTEYSNYDNSNTSGGLGSRFIASESNQCTEGKSKEFVKNIASPYVSLKTYLPSQYGRIDNITWLTTSYMGDLNTPKGVSTNLGIFGGDTYISRHTLKRKVPLFLDSAMGLASLTPFAYQTYSNLGTGIKHYANFYSPKEVTLDRGMPSLNTEYSFDCLTGARDFYVKRPSKFYLYYYGISSFLVESSINSNFRVCGAEYKKQFYPLVEDYADWTQESNVSIREVNYNYYSNTYSGSTLTSIGRTLPYTYEKEVYDTLYDSPNGVIYSTPDNSEKELTEPWLVFKPGDRYEFPSAYGKLQELRGVESAQVLGRFEHTTALFNALDTMVDGITASTAQLGNGGIFRQRPITFSSTDLGYIGTQSYQMVSNEFGHFTVDAKRGQVFQLGVGGGKPSAKEISSDVGGRGAGMRNWFKQNLPFKIKNNLILDQENIDIDNPLNGVGISMGWDSRFKRVFLTKKDYKPIVDLCFNDNKYYVPESQTVIDTTVASGWTYEGVEECQMKFSKAVGEDTEYLYLGVDGVTTTCQEGYTYNETSGKCEKVVDFTPQCPDGYTYNQTTKLCELIVVVDAFCYCDADVIATPDSLDINDGDTAVINLTSTVPGVTFTWTVVNTNVTGPVSGSGALISQVVNGEGTALYTITPTLDGCIGETIDVLVTAISISIPCGGSVSASGNQGIYEVPATIGDATGITSVTFDSFSVPDRIQIIWDGNVVADSLFIGDSLPNVGYETTITDLTTMDRNVWNGTTFEADLTTPTEAVNFTAADIADPTILRSVGTVGQVGVYEFYPDIVDPKSSDGNVIMVFDKTTVGPANILIKVYGITGTSWNITNLECPTEAN